MEMDKVIRENGGLSLTIHQLGDSSQTGDSYIVNSKIGYYFHKFMSRLTGLDGYYSYFATKKAIRTVVAFNPDIIHLRNLHGSYINLPLLFRFLSNFSKPVILNLHDTWAYTAKCPEYENVQCNKWKTECSQCPQWRSYPKSWFFDRSKKLFKDKKKWYSSIDNLHIIGVSDYITDECKKSCLLKGNESVRLYNWINLDSFIPKGIVQKQKTRKKYNLSDGFVVVGCSSYWKKNTEYEEICKLAEMLGGEAQVCLVGGKKVQTPYDNMVHIPNVQDVNELANIYSCADAFVCLSTAESFGKVAAEALACGTPIVVYSTTGIKEIPDDQTGFAVEKHNLEEMKNKLLLIKEAGKNAFSDDCRQRAKELFDYKKNAQMLWNIYKELAKGL